MRLKDFTSSGLSAYGRYCETDTGNCDALFIEFMQSLSPEELLFQSSVLQMYVNPHLVINRRIVEEELARVRARRAAAVTLVCERLGLDDQALLLRVVGSNAKMAEALTLFGVEVPMKISKTTKKPTFALGKTDLAIWLSCSTKAHDIAFVRHGEPGKLHHVAFKLDSWERVLRAADLMSMNKISIDIGPTRHGITRGTTIYAFDPSGNRFETFCGGYDTYPDYKAITWTWDEVGPGIFYHDRKLNERFLTVVS